MYLRATRRQMSQEGGARTSTGVVGENGEVDGAWAHAVRGMDVLQE